MKHRSKRKGSGLLVLSELYLPVKGGHVVWLHEICRRWSGVRLLTNRHAGCPARESIDGVDVRRINLSRWSVLRPESLVLYGNLLLQSLRECRANHPLAILAARVLPEGFVANAVGRLARGLSVVMAHGEEIAPCLPGKPLPARRRATTWLKRKLLWRTFRRANLVVANSGFTRDLLLAGGVRADRVAVVHPGTDPERFRPMPKDAELSRLLKIEGRRVLLTVGRLTPRKGQDVTLRALPAIREHCPDALYVIAGDGEYRNELSRLADELGVSDSVRFLGEVSDASLPSIYSIADVFVMPNRVLSGSDVEGFGIVFLEAAACGLPVVAGRSGGVPDAVSDNVTGLLVDGSSVSEVAAAIVRLLTDNQLACRMGAAGRDRVCGGLTWSQSAERIMQLVRQVADQHGMCAGDGQAWH